MQIHQLQRHTQRALPKRVGRGGVRGKTSGRGHKGQKARAGHSIRPAVRDIIKKLPKLRGYRFQPLSSAYAPVNVGRLENICNNGDVVTPQWLFDNGVITTKKTLRQGVKILGGGDFSRKITVKGCIVSARAAEKITQAGGEVVAS